MLMKTIIRVLLIWCLGTKVVIAQSLLNSSLSLSLELAGDNRAELEKVLKHYEGDNKKLDAARFLIENMASKYSKTNDKIQKYYAAVDSLTKKCPNLKNKDYRSFYDRMAPLDIEKADSLFDVKSIKASYLIKVIDNAFEMQSKPWNSDLSFSLFCNYVLPYRIGKEPLSDWQSLYKDFVWQLLQPWYNVQKRPSLKFGIHEALSNGTILALYTPKSDIPDFPLSIIPRLHVGNCKTNAYLQIAQLRAAGIPATLDFTPQWANRSMGHSWGVFFLNDSTAIPFGKGDHAGAHFNTHPERRLAKVFRETYKDEPMSEIAKDRPKYTPDFLMSCNVLDVTDKYTSASDVNVKLFDNEEVRSSKWIYLAVFDDNNWVPIWYGSNKNGAVDFKNIGRGVAYLPIVFGECGEIIAASHPFIVDDNGIVRNIIADRTNQVEVTLKRKYPFSDNLCSLGRRLNGGKIILAGERNFNDTISEYTIEYDNKSSFFSLKVDENRRAKSLIYISSDTQSSETAELLFYDNNKKQVKPAHVYTDSNDTHGQESKMFDGDMLTYCNLSRMNGQRVCVEFEEPVALSEICIVPRNDGNFIEPGDTYSLFFLSDDGWEDIGTQVASTIGRIVFNNVPTNALLLLHDETKGIEERIFTFENDEQQWW